MRCIAGLNGAEAALVLCTLAAQGQAFSWGKPGRRVGYVPARAPAAPSINVGNMDDLVIPRHSPEFYAEAVHDLEELKSKEVCHRVAAVLLMDNCHLLEGKDDATVLTDAHVRTRDFVEAYAASLAICDLDRTGYDIPNTCAPFTEARLVPLLERGEYGLHVQTGEIKDCLQSLFQTDAAWATWLSYRDKALKFCQASQIDQQKSQNIHLYLKLTKVMAQLFEGVQSDLRRHMDDLDQRARKAGEAVENLHPKLNVLQHGLAQMVDVLNGNLQQTLRKSTETVSTGLKDASDLQELLSRMLEMVTESSSRTAAAYQAHDQSLEHVSGAAQRATDDMKFFVSAMSTAYAFSASLQQQLEQSQLHATELAQRQDSVEHGLNRLIVMTEDISSKFDVHTGQLHSAHNLTTDIVGNLEDAAATASSVKASLLSWSTFTVSFWIANFLWLVAFLVLGNYRLPPSGARNLALITLGELIFLAGAYWDTCTTAFFSLPPLMDTLGDVSWGAIF